MGLREIQFKPAYDSDEDDVLSDFYIPALSNAFSYRRLAGFFSSSALAVAARGISGLIKNGGTMKLVVGAKLRKTDVEAIEKGIKNREEAIAEMMIQDLDSIETEFVKDHVRALAWMVACNKLEIKVAVTLGAHAETLKDLDEGIYHQKVGILSDGNNPPDSISFSGSVNESETGWLRSIEEFKVFRGWVHGENAYLKSDIEKFDKYWNGLAKRAIVIDIPTAVREKLIEIAPKSVDELHLEKHHRPVKTKLWANQVEAIQAWVKNGFKGVLAMATGSGKTLTALSACALAPSSVITIILVPTEPILDQWAKKDIPKFDPSARIIACSGSHPEWKTLLPLELSIVRKTGKNYSPSNRLYVVAILNTAANDSFLLACQGIPSENVQIVCDEVHHVGAPFFQNCMTLPSSRRIGLSATPERNWDPIGTRRIVEYFGPTIYEYGIKSAIQDGHLCHYKYYPYFAFLNKQEFEEFQRLSEEIEKEIARTKTDTKDKEKSSLTITRRLERLLEERARIKKKAKDKVRVFREILSTTDIRPLIVFCEDHEQLNEIKSVLKEKATSYLIYTSEMNDWQRKHVLDAFRKGEADILLAIRCLDEGLDVPECEGCIIVASSSSTREFIQRRGRILRGLKGKLAMLNDIIVVPSEAIGQEDMKAASMLVRQELERVKELAEASDNEWETRNIIRKELAKYGLEVLADI